MISCTDYDYIEIACMYRYPIRLTLRSGSIVEGIALDTQRNEDKEECMKIDSDGSEKLVVLADISIIEVRLENPHFTKVSFGDTLS